MFFKREKKYFSVEETAAFLGKSIGQIDLYIWLKKIPNVAKVDGVSMIPREEVYKLQDNGFSTISENKITFEADSFDNESFSYL